MKPKKIFSDKAHKYDSGYTVESDDHCWLIQKSNSDLKIWIFPELWQQLMKLGEPK